MRVAATSHRKFGCSGWNKTLSATVTIVQPTRLTQLTPRHCFCILPDLANTCLPP